MVPVPMLESEAARLCEILLDREGISPLLNLGSADEHFRREKRPHIDALLFAPLRAAGTVLVHADLKPGVGVDVVGNILDPAVRARLRAMRFGCVLAANLLEHVRDRAAAACACEEIVGPGGLILATAPSFYPYHADPVDTGYRPTPAALAALFAGATPLLVEEIEGPTYAAQIEADGSTVWRELARTLAWSLAFPARPKSVRSRLDRWRWYRRPYRVSIALVQVR